MLQLEAFHKWETSYLKLYKKLLNSPDTTDIIIPDPYIIESAEDNNEYTKNMIEVRNSFLSKLK